MIKIFIKYPSHKTILCQEQTCIQSHNVIEVKSDNFTLAVTYTWVKWIIKKEKNCMMGTWLNLVVVDWMVENLNASLQLGDGRCLSGLNDWRSLF